MAFSDCVSRSVAQKLNVVEALVCGSGFCHILPYWSKRLGKDHIRAYQPSSRGGIIYGATENCRVKMSGNIALNVIFELFKD